MKFIFICFLLCPAALNAASILNGSFEVNAVSPGTNYQAIGGNSTNLTGWTTTLDGVEWFRPSAFSPALGGGQAEEGLYAVDLAFVTSSLSGGIRQVVTTTPGEELVLAFSGSTTRSQGRDGTGLIELWVDGVEVGEYALSNSSTSPVWQDFEYSFLATGASTQIEFRNTQNANLHFANLDNVRFIPEPSSAFLLLSGAGLLFCRRRSIN